jgi:hypothetical protein
MAEFDNGWLLAAKPFLKLTHYSKTTVSLLPTIIKFTDDIKKNGIMYFRSRTCLEHKGVSAATECFRIVDSGQNGSENRANFISTLYRLAIQKMFL